MSRRIRLLFYERADFAKAVREYWFLFPANSSRMGKASGVYDLENASLYEITHFWDSIFNNIGDSIELIESPKAKKKTKKRWRNYENKKFRSYAG